MKINRIVVIRARLDQAILKTDLPEGAWPFEGNADLRLDLAAGSAETYCAANFPGVEIEVIYA